jgi:uncharacterized protein (TIGR02246 family)
MNTAEAAVADVIIRHERALNASDADAALKLYVPDGVLMPPHNASAVGAHEVQRAYEGIFTALTLRLQFDVTEIRQVAPDWVFARTTCSGTSTSKSTMTTSRECNHELIIFQNVDDQWKIARYCFATTLPR